MLHVVCPVAAPTRLNFALVLPMSMIAIRSLAMVPGRSAVRDGWRPTHEGEDTAADAWNRGNNDQQRTDNDRHDDTGYILQAEPEGDAAHQNGRKHDSYDSA